METIYGNIQKLFNFEKLLLDEIGELTVNEYSSGEVLIREQEFIKAIPLVLEGAIKLRKQDPAGREIIFYYVHPGESCILSITSSLNNKQSHAEAISVKHTKLLVVEAGRVREWMEKYPSWRKFVIGLYYERLADLMGLLNEVIFASVDTRLVNYLKENSINSEIEITHQNLAGELGTAREVVSRLLKQMEREGAIELKRGKIKIIRPL